MNTIDVTPDRFACQTDTELRMLGRFIHAVETGVEKIKEEEAAAIKSQEERSFIEITNQGIDHIIAHGEEIPRILKYSQIIALYSFVETRLGLLCEEINRRNSTLQWNPEDFAGNMSVRTFQIFLSKAVDAQVSVWSSLDTMRLVRNCIAHGNGWIDRMERGSAQLRRTISSTKGLDEEKGRIVVSKMYIENAYRSIYTLFHEVFNNLGFGPGLMPIEFLPKSTN